MIIRDCLGCGRPTVYYYCGDCMAKRTKARNIGPFKLWLINHCPRWAPGWFTIWLWK